MNNSSLNNPIHGRLIEEYDNNGFWYRIYSDNWVEQGGISHTDVTWPSINLLIPMKDTSYTAVATMDWLTTPQNGIFSTVIGLKAVDSFTIGIIGRTGQTGVGSYNGNVNWITKGYKG